jgi:hypothetical protein
MMSSIAFRHIVKKVGKSNIFSKWILVKWNHVSEVVRLLLLVNPKDFLQKVLNWYYYLEPKPPRCFSILGIKSLAGQKTFNVECENEEECIKYVDYITILIQNLRANNSNEKIDMKNKPNSSYTVRNPKMPFNIPGKK